MFKGFYEENKRNKPQQKNKTKQNLKKKTF